MTLYSLECGGLLCLHTILPETAYSAQGPGIAFLNYQNYGK